MQSGYGVPEFQQLLVDGCSSLLSMSHDINSSQPQKLHLQDPNHQHPQHHQQQQQQRFHHFQPNSITQQFFQHPLQLQLLQQQQQRRFYQQLGLEQEPGPDNSNSSSRGVGGGGVLPFVVANFKLRDENSGCRGGLNDDETVLVGSGGDSRVAIADHDRWQQQREEDTAIKEPFWIPLDSEYINRNNKRCKDKEEVSNKFCKKDEERDENEERKNSSSNFGLFRELEAIYTHGSLNGSGGCTNQTGSGSALTGENPVTTLAVPKPTYDPRSAIDHASETSTGEEASLKKIKKNKRKRKRMQLSSIAFFFESLVKQLMAHQETLHMKFLEVMEKRDEERTKREEAWRQQEMVKAKREASVRAEEQALASSREAAIVAFLEKITGETINLPTRTQCNSEVQFHEDSQKEQNANQNPEAINNNNVSNENNNCSNNTRRWPKAEVHVLIRVRSSLDSRFQEPGLKGPLWEEVSASMASVGYQRSAKRCKEKWENINKYFRKTKDSAKKRSQFSKTCPYFHQLDQLYSSSSKSSVAKDNSELLDAIVVANDQNPSLEFDGPRFRFSEMGSQSLDFNDNVNEDSSAMARNEEEADNEEEEDDDDDEEEEDNDEQKAEKDNGFGEDRLHKLKQGTETVCGEKETVKGTLFFRLES
eukprot:TRINITY_DN369_c2_g1_i3.p1 TRINITY_DN369_c2_g1~~TRINITY_DN369_c2_g1_i3.p1  ORF type:complete len:648 (-),score=176.76 TRINITY_DN369_c2_g1_i3:423-2366(-)